MADYKHIFGPVPSRRLGRSLGVDLTPGKTCTFDCVYCQLGRTIYKTLRRKEYVPSQQVTNEFQNWLRQRVEADYITLSGSGEPTLHSQFGDLIQEIKSRAETPVALLTNGSLLCDVDVARAASPADLVKVSLCAWNQESFEAINRPHPDVVFGDVVSGIHRLRQRFNGELWVEVFVVPGLNSEPEQMEQIAEVIEDCTAPGSKGFRTVSQTIRHILERRPCTADQMAAVSGLHRAEISKHLGRLLHQGELRTVRRQDEVYFETRSSRERPHA